MLQTTDGGTTWTPQTVPTSGLYINSVTFADANNGIAVCSSGKVLTTSDGGGTWATPETYLSSSGLCVRFRGDGSTTNACSVGLYGLTITTANAGADWTLRSSLFSNGILDIDFLDQAHGWLLDDVGHVRRTSDGGVTWGAPVEVDLYSYFKAMDFVSPTTGWVVGEGGAVFKTTDGGATWNPQTSNTTCNLWDVRFLDASTGWAVGSYYTPADTNVILKTTDGGTTWVPRSDVAGTTKPIRAIDVLDANTAWAVGQAGILLKTTNGGADWAVNIDHPTAELYGVDFVDANVGWAVGDNGTVLKTADGGATWTPVTVGTTEYLQSVRFADANTGWIVGFNGTVLYTVDGGTTWHSALTTSPSFTSIALTGRNTGWLAGGGGALVEITAPKAMIDTAWPSSVIRGQTVWLVGHGTDTNGHSITGYSWRSSRDGVISSASGFGTASLSVGTHTIYYKVLCTEGIWGPEVATTVVVSLPRAYLSRPYAPTSVSRYSYFTSYGYLKPRHRRGTYPVKLYCYRYQYGKWVLRKTYWAKAYDYRTYTKYSKSIRLPYKGKWKVLAYHPADGHNSATWSTARYVYAR